VFPLFVHSGRIGVSEMKQPRLKVAKRNLGLINNTSKTSTQELVPLTELLQSKEI